MNRSEIFKAAHNLVPSYRNQFSSYKAAFSFCLKRAYKTASINTTFTSESFAKAAKAVDPAINMVVTGTIISGNYRGKSSESFKFDFIKREFIFNNAGYSVRKVFQTI